MRVVLNLPLSWSCEPVSGSPESSPDCQWVQGWLPPRHSRLQRWIFLLQEKISGSPDTPAIVHRELVFSGNTHIRINSDNEKVRGGGRGNCILPGAHCLCQRQLESSSQTKCCNLTYGYYFLSVFLVGCRPSFKQAKTILKFRVSKDDFWCLSFKITSLLQDSSTYT